MLKEYCLTAQGNHFLLNLSLSQIAYVMGVLKLSEPADFKIENCPRFVGVIEENKEQSVQLSLLMRYSYTVLTKVNVQT